MILNLLLNLALIGASQTRPQIPDAEFWHNLEPYIGAGLAPFPYWIQSADKTTRYRHHQKFLEIGLPYRFHTFYDSGVPMVDMLFTPEFLFSPDLFSMDATVGPEIKFSFGRYAMPSQLFFGAQFGGYLSVPIESVVDDLSYAMVVGAYFGPEFDLYDKVAFKVQINSKFLLGSLAKNSVRTMFANDVGYILGFNFQFEFL